MSMQYYYASFSNGGHENKELLQNLLDSEPEAVKAWELFNANETYWKSLKNPEMYFYNSLQRGMELISHPYDLQIRIAYLVAKRKIFMERGGIRDSVDPTRSEAQSPLIKSSFNVGQRRLSETIEKLVPIPGCLCTFCGINKI